MTVPDYKEMYLTLLHASEDAINTLIAAQQRCEELYLSGSEANLKMIPQNEVPKTPKNKPDLK